MRATLQIAQLIRASSYFPKEDGLLVAHGRHCYLRSVMDGVYFEILLQARDIEPGVTLIPQRSLKALGYADESEVTFFENEQSSGFITPLGSSYVQEGPAPRTPTSHPAALASPLRDFHASQQGWTLPTRTFRRALQLLQRLGSIRVLHGTMVAKGPQESIIVRSGVIDSLPFGIVPAAVDPLLTLLKSNTEVVVKTGAGKTIVQAGDIAMGWLASPDEPINIHPLPTACTVRVLKHDFEKRLRIASKGTTTMLCKADEAVLALKKEGMYSPLKVKLLSGSAVGVRIDPVRLLAHVRIMKGAEIEVGVGPRWVQLRGAEVVPGTSGEILEVTTLLAGESL